MAMLDTVLDFGGSPSANIGPSWWGDIFHPVKKLPGQLLGLGYALTNTVSDHAAVDKAEALYRAAGFNADCREDQVQGAGGVSGYYNRLCSINGKDGFGVDNVVYSYPNGLPQYFIDQLRQSLGLNTYSDPNKNTIYDSNVPPTGTNTDASELSGARQALMAAMQRNGVAGNAAILAKMESALIEGKAWWMTSHPNYEGLTAWTSANADAAVQSWIKALGVKSPDGTAKTPTSPGSGQGGNADTPNSDTTSANLSTNTTFTLGTPMLIAGAAVVALILMNKGGK